MRAVDSFIKVNPEVARVRERIRSYQTAYDNVTRNIEQNQERHTAALSIQEVLISYVDTIREDVQTLMPPNMNNVYGSDILEVIGSLKFNRPLGRLINEYNNWINDQGNYLSHLAREKETLESLSANAEETHITKESCEAALYSLDNVIPESVKMFEDTDGHTYLEWGITGVKMKPNSNPFSWINNGGPVTINIEDVLVKIRLNDTELRLTPYTHTEFSAPYIYSGEHHVHPHVIGSHNPCLGDWGGPITEAIHDLNWAVASGMLTTFLSNADSNDDAGGRWHLGITNGYYGTGSRNEFKVATNSDLPHIKYMKFNEVSPGSGEFIPSYYDADMLEVTHNYHKFEVDDVVMMAETSEYYLATRTNGTNPANTEGRIISIGTVGRSSIKVRWPDGTNSYNFGDLVWVENPQHQLPESLSEIPQSAIPFPSFDGTTIGEASGFDMATGNIITGRVPGTPSLFD